jgi:Zn-dependent protease with chaperone function
MPLEFPDEQTTLPLPLEPLAYHKTLVNHLASRETELWAWFSADKLREQHNEAVRLELLKATYRIERDANPALYTALDEVSKVLELDVPVTFYQSPGVGALNASLAYMPGEAHIVFTGPVLTTLTPTEVRCVIGHELMHFALLDRWRDYLVATQLLAAMANDPQAQPSHHASDRRLRLYTEVYCDRGAYKATGDLAGSITALVKMETGTTEITAESYLRQTDEIFTKGHPRTEGITHPETFVRARALKLWADNPETAARDIAQVIEGPISLEDLDLLGQQRISATTRKLIEAFLQPAWIQTEAQLAHARLFFDDFKPVPKEPDSLARDVTGVTGKLHDYYCYILLDFATADRELEEAPLAAALLMADELGLGERFRQLAAKELNLRKKQLEMLSAEARTIVAKAQEATN